MIFQSLVHYFLLRGCNWSLNSSSLNSLYIYLYIYIYIYISIYIYLYIYIRYCKSNKRFISVRVWKLTFSKYSISGCPHFSNNSMDCITWNNICFHSEFSFFLFCSSFFFYFYLLKCCYVMFEQNGEYFIFEVWIFFFVVHRNENSIYIYISLPHLFFVSFHLSNFI